jgi:hypothetical protein
MRRQAHTVIAEHFGQDSREVHESRHHYGQTMQPIYVLGDDYYAVSKDAPKDQYGKGWALEAVHQGRNIWKSQA